jgi:hypothetical protein
VVPIAVGIAGCDSKPHTVKKADVEGQISAKMTDAAGTKPESVSCPADLTGQVGSTLTCQMTVKTGDYGVLVTVTAVDSGQPKFDIVQLIDKGQVASAIDSSLEKKVARKLDVKCPDNLKGTQGATLRCDIADQGKTYGVTVTVDSVNGTDIHYAWKVDDQPRQ